MTRTIPTQTALRFVLILCSLLALLMPSASASAQEQRCFAETGFCISGTIRAYWEKNGGLPVFGFPISAAQDELNRDTGQTYLTQWFERNRLEVHPENAGTPYEVLLGRLGDDRLIQQGRPWHGLPKGDPAAPHYFPETSHAIAPQFWPSWSGRGLDLGDAGISQREALALFGMPISEAALETNSSGDTVLTQWFERARFEHHPGNQPPYDVLLGLLGNEVRTPPAPPPPPPPPARPGCTDVPAGQGQVTPACVFAGESFIAVLHGLARYEGIRGVIVSPEGAWMNIPVIEAAVEPTTHGEYWLRAAIPFGTPPGIYQVFITSEKSNANARAYLRVVPNDPSQPIEKDEGALPPNVNVQFRGFDTHRGGAFTVEGYGFTPGEPLQVFLVTPDGSTLELSSYDVPWTADVTGSLALDYTFSKFADYGIYTFIFKGTQSQVVGSGSIRKSISPP